MTKRNKKKVVEERWMKKEVEVREEDKFLEKRKIPPLEAKSETQKDYLASLNRNQITVARGHSGCGKSYCASYEAARLLLAKEVSSVIVTRPYAHLGKDYGATPGSDFEKLEPFCRPMLDVLKRYLGAGHYNYCIDKKIIEVVPLEKIQGRSFDEPCCIIADEIQNATKPQVMSLVTRLGWDVSFLAICGDQRQSINRENNALDWIAEFFQRHNISGVDIVNFSEDDCVRSGIVKEILVAFEKEGGFYNTL
jgi:phosphate starvation-inducible PhoH-like protein